MHSPTPSDHAMILDESVYDVTESMMQANPFNPPHSCVINTLPDELLVYIMELGADNDDDDDDDDQLQNYLDSQDYEEDNEVFVQDGKVVDKDSLPVVEDDDSEWEEEEEEASGSDSGSGSTMTTEDDPPTLSFPVLCSHVCSRWRLLAIETPSFWTKLDFAAGLPLSRALALIERSKSLPLDINIDLGDDEDGSDAESESESDTSFPATSMDFVPGRWNLLSAFRAGGTKPKSEHSSIHEDTSLEDLDEILRLIMPEVHRWRTFHMTSDHYENLYKVLEALEKCTGAPLLEDLDLRSYTEGDDLETPLPEHLNKRFVLFHANTPRLRFLSLFEAALDWEGCIPMFTHLQKLELAHHSPDRCPTYEAFQKMTPSCKDLHLRHSGPVPLPSSGDITELPLLQDFTLAVHEARYAEELYPLLRIPNVTRLVLDCSEEDYSSFGQMLAHGNQREKSLLSRLKELRVDGLPCSKATKTEMVQQMGLLHTLQLYSFDEESEFLEVLMEAAGENGAHCPKLKKVLTRSVPGNTMREFVEARKKLGVPVESVFMAKHDDVDKDEHEWLKNNVHFGYFSPSDSDEEIEISDDDLSLLL